MVDLLFVNVKYGKAYFGLSWIKYFFKSLFAMYSITSTSCKLEVLQHDQYKAQYTISFQHRIELAILEHWAI